jgi:hypothetical protein
VGDQSAPIPEKITSELRRSIVEKQSVENDGTERYCMAAA